MGGGVKGLLGGGGQKASTTSSSAPWEAVQPYLKDLFKQGQNAQQTMSAATMPTQLTAGFTPEQLLAQQQQLNMANNLSGEIPKSLDALNFGLNAADVANNPYLNKAIQAAINPVVANFNRSVIPAQELNAIVNSGYGSSRHGIAEGIARSDLNRQLLDTTSTMSSNAYNTGLSTMMNALSQAPKTYASMLLPSTITEGVGQQKQAMEQQLLTDELTRWNFDRTKMMDSLQQYAALLNGNFGGTSTSTSKQSGGGSTLGTIAGLASVAGGLF